MRGLDLAFAMALFMVLCKKADERDVVLSASALVDGLKRQSLASHSVDVPAHLHTDDALLVDGRSSVVLFSGGILIGADTKFDNDLIGDVSNSSVPIALGLFKFTVLLRAFFSAASCSSSSRIMRRSSLKSWFNWSSADEPRVEHSPPPPPPTSSPKPFERYFSLS